MLFADVNHNLYSMESKDADIPNMSQALAYVFLIISKKVDVNYEAPIAKNNAYIMCLTISGKSAINVFWVDIRFLIYRENFHYITNFVLTYFLLLLLYLLFLYPFPFVYSFHSFAYYFHYTFH